MAVKRSALSRAGPLQLGSLKDAEGLAILVRTPPLRPRVRGAFATGRPAGALCASRSKRDAVNDTAKDERPGPGVALV